MTLSAEQPRASAISRICGVGHDALEPQKAAFPAETIVSSQPFDLREYGQCMLYALLAVWIAPLASLAVVGEAVADGRAEAIVTFEIQCDMGKDFLQNRS